MPKNEKKLVEEFANCYDVVIYMPKFLYARYQLGGLDIVLKQIGRDLMNYLSRNHEEIEVKNIFTSSIEEIRFRREAFGQFEVFPYFNIRMLNSLIKLHSQALDIAILTVLGREGLLRIYREDVKSIKNKIWAGLELNVYSMLGGIEIVDYVQSVEIAKDISDECVQILYSELKESVGNSFVNSEKEVILRQILSVLDLKQRIVFYGLDQDLWRFFTVIESVRLLGVTGEFVHDLIELSILLKKLEELEEEISRD